MLTSSGIIPVDPAVVTHNVDLVLDSISPSTLNPAGGELVTVYGSGFPAATGTNDAI